ncbi:MAG: hypothetical protein ACUVRJ_02505 [Candidatus Villigracilaceae bacterium]
MKRLFASLLALLFVFALSGTVVAQTYAFSLDQEIVHVYWNDDGTSAIDYLFTFSNSANASPIDFVDVGLPNGSYERDRISADVNGQPVAISSDYQGNDPYGIAVELGRYAIQPGQTGNVHVYIGRIKRVLYQDDEDKNYVSGVFSPTWFGSQYVYGNTDLMVVFHLPPGVQPEEPRYHLPDPNWPGAQAPEMGWDSSGRITYTWHSPNANGSTQYKFGASFPQKYIPADAIVTPSLFETLNINIEDLCLLGCIGLFFVGIPLYTAIAQRKRKLQYLPPKVSIEGHGIKRGLTAVEAAVLMETPLDKVMTMILFSVIKKGAAEVLSRDPLKLQVAEPLPEGLQEYEKDFLDAFKAENLAQQRAALQDMTVKLIRSVSGKMRGFSRKETIEYYKSINERAWQQIEAADTPEVKSQMYEQALEWTMLDKNYDERARRTFTGPVVVPTWWGRYDPAYRPAASGTPSKVMPTMTSTQGKAPTATIPGAAFAASVVSGAQNFASRVLGDVGSFTNKVMNVTNPPPPPSISSSSRSSGGCACACACAGCACACAGGGR